MTTVKHRIIGANKYLLRVDDEMPLVMSEYQSNRVVKTLQKYEPEYIVVSDYAKGMVTPQLVEALQAGMKK